MNWEIIVAISSALSFLGSIVIQFLGRSQWQGEVGARLKAHDETIQEMKQVDRDQWDEINSHGNDIAALKAGRGKANSHGIV